MTQVPIERLKELLRELDECGIPCGDYACVPDTASALRELISLRERASDTPPPLTAEALIAILSHHDSRCAAGYNGSCETAVSHTGLIAGLKRLCKQVSR